MPKSPCPGRPAAEDSAAEDSAAEDSDAEDSDAEDSDAAVSTAEDSAAGDASPGAEAYHVLMRSTLEALGPRALSIVLVAMTSGCGTESGGRDAGIDASTVDASTIAPGRDAAPGDDAAMEEDAGSLDANALDAGTESSPFGIRALMTPLVGGPRWTSAHWANGHPRQLTSARDLDADDPTGWSSLRGSGSTLAMEIDGDGVMTLVGNQPRIYLTPTPRPFENVEVTFYYRRDTDDDTPWGGAIVGMRSGVDGHSDGNCDAHTYYARLRHDGDHDFEKELQHPASASRDSVTLYPTGLPRGVWIGVKVVLYTRADGAVVLDHYRDLTEGADGGTWERMGTQTVDDGGWAPAQGPECGRADDYIIIEPGSVLIRDTMGDAGRAHYRWLSVVEITPPG